MSYDVSAVSRIYAEAACDYAERFGNDLADNAFDREILSSVLRAAPANALVLDVGCGPGQVAALASAHGVAAIGLDLTFEMLEVARARVTAPLACGDVRAAPFRSASFDVVVCWYSLHHLARAELAEVLTEIARLTRARGFFVIATHAGRGEYEERGVVVTYYDGGELSDAVRAAGFERVVVRTRLADAHEHGDQKLIVSGVRR